MGHRGFVNRCFMAEDAILGVSKPAKGSLPSQGRARQPGARARGGSQKSHALISRSPARLRRESDVRAPCGRVMFRIFVWSAVFGETLWRLYARSVCHTELPVRPRVWLRAFSARRGLAHRAMQALGGAQRCDRRAGRCRAFCTDTPAARAISTPLWTLGAFPWPYPRQMCPARGRVSSASPSDARRLDHVGIATCDPVTVPAEVLDGCPG